MRLGSAFVRDLTYGLRSMRRAPVSSATAVVALALGVAANAAVFSVMNKVLLEPLPYPTPDRLIQVFCASPMGPALAASVSKLWPGANSAQSFSMSPQQAPSNR